MREASQLPGTSIVDVDPEDPAQLLDDAGQYSVVDTGLEVEAQPSAEAEADIDAAVIIAQGEADEGDESETLEAEALEAGASSEAAEIIEEEAREPDTSEPMAADAYISAIGDDTGELYGVHTPHATDNELDKTADNESFIDSEAGETWLETLGKKASEYGAEAEEELDVVDDSDHHPDHRGHHKSDTRDRPVADKGSGGEGGL